MFCPSDPERRLNLERLLPGILHFGAEALQLTIARRISSFRIYLPERGILNLDHLDINSPEATESNIKRVVMSSMHKSSADPSQLLIGRPIHTEQEPIPSWQLDFLRPHYLQSLSIGNRLGIWSGRSYALCLELTDTTGSKSVYRHDGDANVVRRLDEFDRCVRFASAAAAKTDVELAQNLMADGEAISRLVRATINGNPTPPVQAFAARAALLEDVVKVASRLTGAPLIAAIRELSPLADYLIPRSSHMPTEGIFEQELRASALVFSRILVDRDTIPMNIVREFDRLIVNGHSVASLEADINELYDRMAIGRADLPLLFRAHGMSGSTLLARKDEFLNSMKDVEVTLRSLAYDCAICYGTLLGAVRDKGFIPHDDDVDMAISLRATSSAEADVELNSIVEQLKALGVSASVTAGQKFLKVKSPKHGRYVDVFPIFTEDGQIKMYMERLQIRNVSPENVLPFGKLSLYGMEFLAPARPEAFLADRYGDSWNVPRRIVGYKTLDATRAPARAVEDSGSEF